MDSDQDKIREGFKTIIEKSLKQTGMTLEELKTCLTNTN